MAAAHPDRPGRQVDEATPELAIIVVNWRRPRQTVDCCRQLLAWSRLRCEVLVVDNGSGREVVEHLESELPGAKVIASPTNRGFAGANNLALEAVAAEFVLLLNNDASLDEDSAGSLIDFLREAPQAGIAGPVLEAAAPPHEVLAAGGRDILRRGRTHATASERRQEIAGAQPFVVPYVPGTAAILRTDLLRSLGGLDEEFFFSGEMADLGRRAATHGMTSHIVPSARARHDLAVASELRDSLYAYYSLRNRFLYARRHARPAALHLAHWTLRGGITALGALVRGKTKRTRWLARAVSDGLRGRFGPADQPSATETTP